MSTPTARRYAVGDPDPTAAPLDGADPLADCPVKGTFPNGSRGAWCTWSRSTPHTQHVAGTGTTVVAVWDDPQAEVAGAAGPVWTGMRAQDFDADVRLSLFDPPASMVAPSKATQPELFG